MLRRTEQLWSKKFGGQIPCKTAAWNCGEVDAKRTVKVVFKEVDGTYPRSRLMEAMAVLPPCIYLPYIKIFI
jgi:hypothetical protein